MNPLHRQIRRIHLLLVGGRLLRIALGLGALVLLLWLAFGCVDRLAAFEPPARTTITIALVAFCGLAALVGLAFAWQVTPTQAAARADAVRNDPRRRASAALSLPPTRDAAPMADFLAQRMRNDSTATLASLSATKIVPWRELGTPALAVAGLLAAAALLRTATPAPFGAIAERLCHPASDLPPYSEFHFTITPDQPSTIYGGEILVTTRITGGTPLKPVECLVRTVRNRKIQRLPAYGEAPGRYSRKLDGLTEPIEIAFAIGKARSAWHSVDILLQPNILAGFVRLTPPAYTELKETGFQLDSNEISALEGATVTLELTSNRPLGSGTLVFTPQSTPGAEAEPVEIPARITSGNTAMFSWTSLRAGRLSASLRDLRGTPTPRPLEIAFRPLPDQPPAVELASPPRLLLATPHSKIQVKGRAEDDFALSTLRFVRTLAGFRDRSHVVAPELHEQTFDFTDVLDLYDLGLDAGQVIELMLEASDHNPSLLGKAVRKCPESR